MRSDAGIIEGIEYIVHRIFYIVCRHAQEMQQKKRNWISPSPPLPCPPLPSSSSSFSPDDDPVCWQIDPSGEGTGRTQHRYCSYSGTEKTTVKLLRSDRKFCFFEGWGGGGGELYYDLYEGFLILHDWNFNPTPKFIYHSSNQPFILFISSLIDPSIYSFINRSIHVDFLACFRASLLPFYFHLPHYLSPTPYFTHPIQPRSPLFTSPYLITTHYSRTWSISWLNGSPFFPCQASMMISHPKGDRDLQNLLHSHMEIDC